MKKRIKMKLLSDAVFGNGVSVPGGEDISILCDQYGFPYYKGSTFKGVFREELERYLGWTVPSEKEAEKKLAQLLGKSGDFTHDSGHKVIFSDFTLSSAAREQIRDEMEAEGTALSDGAAGYSGLITDSLSHLRTFTRLDENGLAQEGSLRSCRCVNKGLSFYSEMSCSQEDLPIIKDVLSMVKWVGTMRNRGFGKVLISVDEKGV